MEAVDVDAGEYPALFTLDGRIVTVTTEAEQVVLTVDEQRDEAGLRQRLLDARPRVGLTSPPDDLVASANELLRLEWERDGRSDRAGWPDGCTAKVHMRCRRLCWLSSDGAGSPESILWPVPDATRPDGHWT
jgi:hypothetical protein